MPRNKKKADIRGALAKKFHQFFDNFAKEVTIYVVNLEFDGYYDGPTTGYVSPQTCIEVFDSAEKAVEYANTTMSSRDCSEHGNTGFWPTDEDDEPLICFVFDGKKFGLHGKAKSAVRIRSEGIGISVTSQKERVSGDFISTIGVGLLSPYSFIKALEGLV